MNEKESNIYEEKLKDALSFNFKNLLFIYSIINFINS